MVDKKGNKEIKSKTPEMEAHLAVGYGMDLAQAKRIIAERDKDPHLWPYEEYRKAQAFIEAYESVPQVISSSRALTI